LIKAGTALIKKLFMKLTNVFTLIVISILGMLSITLPIFILEDLKSYDSPLFPLIRTGIEGVSKFSLFFLFLSGFMIKFFSDLSSWKIGLASMVLFPLAAFLEMAVDSSSHNMFPVEFISYAIYTLPAVLGASISQIIKKINFKRGCSSVG
jgi:hypothetical protein